MYQNITGFLGGLVIECPKFQESLKIITKNFYEYLKIRKNLHFKLTYRKVSVYNTNRNIGVK